MPGPAQLLKFARGDLIRLSFEEGLSDQVAVLIDDWVIRVGRALGRFAGTRPRHELESAPSPIWIATPASASARASPGFATSSARRRFSIAFPLIDDEIHTRFPLTEHLWLRRRRPVG